MKKFLSLTIVMLAFAIGASAQAQITGTVIDDLNNESLIGATVVEKGTTNGTITDFDGNFTLTTKNESGIVTISFIGYLSQEVEFSGNAKLTINLKADVTGLEEVVVIGYGSLKKSDVTGSVSSVKSDELNAFPVLNAEQALQGRAAGVVVQSNNGGEPGAPISIKIRGNTSLTASSDPLIVVDGFVGASMPQPNDIESMEVLKDASAAAIYGSRGSNGVIMVTTKKGKAGELSIAVNSTYSTSQTANQLDLLNANEFASYQQIMNPGYVQGSADTDWQDLLYRRGSVQDHQFSFTGGSDNINFYASANYFKQEGVLLNSAYERFSFLSNVDAQINDKLKLGINLFMSRGNKDGVATQSTGDTANGGGDDIVGLMFRFTPDRGIYNENGTYTTSSTGDDVDNPWAVATQRVNETKSDRARANLYLNYDINENLTFKTTFGFSSLNETVGSYVPSSLRIQDQGNGGNAAIENKKSTKLLSENYLTYKKELGKGDLTLLAGYSYQMNNTFRFSAGSTGLIKDSFSYYNLAGSATSTIPTSSYIESEIQSQFGRVNYDYDNRFLLTGTIRRDGASNFSENEKYAFFPSAAIGWRMSNESFLKDNETISNLKLRASYGVTGNADIPSYASFAKLTDVAGLSGGQVVSGVAFDQAANANLKWESSYQTNLGIDLGLFDNRISVGLDYYNIDTKDLLMYDYGQPQYLGYQTAFALSNIGEINNKGFEVSISTKNINKDNLTWTTDFNISSNKTEVIKLIDGLDVFLDASPSYFSRSDSHILREGETPGVFWGYDYQGVYQGGTLPAGTATLSGGIEGDPLFADLDNSGEINTDDKQIIGDPTPNFTFGLNNTVIYKNFDLNVFIQGSQGGEVFNLTNVQLFNGDGNATKDVLNAWTTSNKDTNTPRVGNNSSREFSTRFVEDGSYVRLKNIALGYNLPSDISKKIGMENVRLSVSAQNLLTLTSYSGLDPEVSYFGAGGDNTNANTTAGFDYGNYPTIKSFTFSVNLKF